MRLPHWLFLDQLAGRVGRLVLPLLLLLVVMSAWGAPSYSLPAGNAITDGPTLLRLALPFDQPAVRVIDQNVSEVAALLKRGRWGNADRNVRQAQRQLTQRQNQIVAAGAEAERVAQLGDDLAALAGAIATKDKDAANAQNAKVIASLEAVENQLVKGFPYDIPEAYAQLPQLLGRATVELTTEAGTMRAVIDGYSAPVTAGNFIDLVQKGFYNNLSFDQVEDLYFLQVGDPAGPADGYIDPVTGQKRVLPLEILAKGDALPHYGETFEEAGIFEAETALPFSAKGTLAMARYPDEVNSASSQFFIFIAEPDLTPAGLNLLDGRYSTFGYVVDGLAVIDGIRQGDHVLSAKVISGGENLRS